MYEFPVLIGTIMQIWISATCERHVDGSYIPKMAKVGSFETSVRSTRLHGITSPSKKKVMFLVTNVKPQSSQILRNPVGWRVVSHRRPPSSDIYYTPGTENDGKLSNDRQTDRQTTHDILLLHIRLDHFQTCSPH